MDSLNVRDGPGTNHRMIGVMPHGAIVSTYGCVPRDDGIAGPEWCQVAWQGNRGWASTAGMMPEAQAPQPAPPQPTPAPAVPPVAAQPTTTPSGADESGKNQLAPHAAPPTAQMQPEDQQPAPPPSVSQDSPPTSSVAYTDPTFLVHARGNRLTPNLQTVIMQLSSESDVAIVDIIVNGHSLREAKEYVTARDREIGNGAQLEQMPQVNMPAGVPTTPFCGGACMSYRIGQMRQQQQAMQQEVNARNAQRQQSYNARLEAFNAAHASGYRALQIWGSDLHLPVRLKFGDESQIVANANVIQVKIVCACDPHASDINAPICGQVTYTFDGEMR
jgi:uncharacterized protein YraI